MPAKQTYYCVSIAVNPDDSGFCVTFLDEAAALKCYHESLEEGCFAVTYWTS